MNEQNKTISKSSYKQKDSEPSDQKWLLNLLPPPPGMSDRQSPRMRQPDTSPILPWQPKIFPTLRSSISMLPAKWDWRNVENQNWITPIRSQGQCGACVAFAVTAAVESHLMIKKGDSTDKYELDLSEASLFFTANRQCSERDPRYGWYISEALESLVSSGVCLEENYPFRPINQIPILSKGTEQTYKINGYDASRALYRIKRWLVEEGPLITMFIVNDNFMEFWYNGAQGIYKQPDGEILGRHAVVVVGYDDAEECWICKNSHPLLKGNNGFFKIAYGTAGIDDKMYLIQDVYEVDTRNEYHYKPHSLHINDKGDSGWELTDGKKILKILDNKEDAQNALKVAKRHLYYGVIGENNGRKNKQDYIIEYWRGDSGLTHEPLSQQDCVSYDVETVTALNPDSEGWVLKYGKSQRMLTHDMKDALAALRLIQRHSRQGFIGRGNKRPDPKKYTMTYWE